MTTIIAEIFRSRLLCLGMACWTLDVAFDRLTVGAFVISAFWWAASVVQVIERHRQNKVRWAQLRADQLAKRVAELRAEPPRKVPISDGTPCCRCDDPSIGKVQLPDKTTVPVCFIHASEIANELTDTFRQSLAANHRPGKSNVADTAGDRPDDGADAGRDGTGAGGGSDGSAGDRRGAGVAPGGADVGTE